MAMSRTARILVAILLLAAAAFFWVNFYYQSRTAELPVTDPVVADADALPDDGAAAIDENAVEGEATAEGEATVEGDAEAIITDAETTDAEAEAAVDGEGVDLTEADAETEPVEGEPVAATDDPEADAEVAAADAEVPDATDAAVADPDAVDPDEPPLVVLDAPVAVSRDIVIADLPFLVTEPAPVAASDTDTNTAETEPVQGVTAVTRATINPFSPVVVRVPPAPERVVPETTAVVDVAVPPPPATVLAAPVRAAAPTPRPLAPAATTAEFPRALPTGRVLSSTPALLREPRVGSPAEEVDFASVAAVAVPDAEPTALEPREPTRPPDVSVDNPTPLGPLAVVFPEPEPEPEPVVVDAVAEPEPDAAPAATTPAAAIPVGPPPLAAGASELARFLRDENFSFTGSVLGPVSVGVFRSDLDNVPLVVALGQTLPDTDIVLTDLRGQQAELRLGDITQILTLDIRR